MLNLLWMPRQASQKEIFKNFDPLRQLWVVSDAKTKFFLNQSLLERSEIISEPVKRAKELWRELLARVEPDIRIIEDLGTRIAAREYLLAHGQSEWCQRPRAPDKLIEACRQLGPLISHDSAPEVLEQFEEEFKKAGAPFIEISRLAAGFYLHCLSKKRAPHFLVPYLLSRRDELPFLEKEVFFDLGFDLRHGERELIQFLSKENNVSVIIPAEDEKDLDQKGLITYKNFDLGLNQVTQNRIYLEDPYEPKILLWRCSSPESEARQAVEQIGKWVDSGIKPSSICIAAPTVSTYEDILEHDLRWEGLGFQRALKAPLSSTRLFRALSSRLRVINGELDGQILEEAFLTVSHYRQKTQRRDERRTFGPVVKVSQIPQEELQQEINRLRSLKPKGLSQIRKFEEIVVGLFDGLTESRDDTLFMKALQNLRTEVAGSDLEFGVWVEAWQEITSKISINFQNASEEGVWGTDLSSCEEIPADYLIILGCTESKNHGDSVNGIDQEKLKFLLQLGFDLAPPLRHKIDNFIQWILSGPKKEVFLSCPKTDSKGRSVGASPLWVKKATQEKRDLEFLNSAHDTQWIYVQRAILNADTARAVSAFKEWDEQKITNLSARILEETNKAREVLLGEEKAQPFSQTISASQIEAYWECPYKFYARSYLKLFDEDDLELEPSALAKGQWIHAAVEKIMKDQKDLKAWNQDDLIAMIDSLDQVQKQLSSEIWPNIRARFLRQLNRFIDFENQWQSDYINCKATYFEAAIEGYIVWNTKDQTIVFAKNKPEDESLFWVPFRGRIDRIDQTSKNKTVILDYKSGGGSATHIGSWAQNGNFQLALYSNAVEAGLLEVGPREVVAAQYYVLKNLQRDKGFWLSDEDMQGVLPTKKNKGAVDRENRDKYFNEIKTQVHNILEKIRTGVMTPKPQDESICQLCSWRTSCRAPHLD